MARVDFYVLGEAGEQVRQAFACRLAEKAYRLNNTVHIEAADAEGAKRLDDLLWTFRDGSFVPHQLLGDSPHEAPVTIGFGGTDVPARDLLINLSPEIPGIAETFPRIAELVSADDECKQQSRKRFASYRDQGHTIDTHNV
ncbi:MAG: DNA polymerase III subunit chi [Gammaproteobacteria bacterium]|nr:DNA polymerase III subunit chi [Gammaproteobacteria bacterium]